MNQLDSPFPTMLAGGRLTSKMMNSRNTKVEFLDTTVTVTNSTSWVSTDLTLDLEPDAMYEYNLFVSIVTDAAADARLAWLSDPGVTPARFTTAPNRDYTAINSGAEIIMRRPATTTIGVAGGPNGQYTHFSDFGTIITAAGGGSMTLRVAQDTANANPTTFYGLDGGRSAHTHCIYRRIS